MQLVSRPLAHCFDSKSAVEIVNTLAGGSESAVELIKASATSANASKAWNALLHDGFADVAIEEVATGTLDMSDVAVSAPLKGLEFYTYTKAGMGAGTMQITHGRTNYLIR